MACFRLWLHPLHRRKVHLPLQISEMQQASSHGDRISVLREVCCEASSSVIDVAQLTEVIMHSDALVARSELVGNPPKLPLRLSQVCEYHIAERPTERSDGVLGMIAYAHPMTAYTARGQESESSESTQSDVWVLVVTDGAPCAAPSRKPTYVLSQAMHAIIGRGAISGETGRFKIMNKSKAEGGGFGTVHFFWRNHDTSSKAYAGKLLDDGQAMSACLESDTLLAARNHPNIVAFIGTFCFLNASQERKWMIVTEAHLGGDIESRVRRWGAFIDREALQISAGVLSAVSHLHEHDIIHRDVKPANVVLASDGRAVLIDMGIAVHTSESKELMRRCGTPGYIAPEILFRRGCQFKSDVFGCGAFLYFAASGMVPFQGSSKKDTIVLNARADVKFDDRRFLTIAPHIIEIMRNMLQQSPSRRSNARFALNAISMVIAMTSPAELPGQAPHEIGQNLSKLATPSDQASSSTCQSMKERARGFSSLQTVEMSSFSSISGASTMCSTVGGRGPTPDEKASEQRFLKMASTARGRGPAPGTKAIKQGFIVKARALLCQMKQMKQVSSEVTPFVATAQAA